MEEKTPDAQREQMRQHFVNLPPDQHPKGWDDMWLNNITPWDKDQPNPALIDALQEKNTEFGSPFKDGKIGNPRRKVLIPGCGRGRDALLFSSYGFDAYGLDASPKAIEEANKLLAEQAKEQEYPMQNIQNGRGSITFLAGDFFKSDFLAQTHARECADRTFDLIYDHTFLCALPPELRPPWAARMSQLLSATGKLLCFEFPLGKAPKLGGPPHGLETELYEQLLAKPGNEVNYNLSGSVCEDRSGDKTDNALVKVESWAPKRVFPGQERQALMSVWKLWKP